MPRRRKFERALWTDQLKLLKEEVEAMPHGPERNAVERRAQQLDAAIHMDGWLKSGELKPPS